MILLTNFDHKDRKMSHRLDSSGWALPHKILENFGFFRFRYFHVEDSGIPIIPPVYLSEYASTCKTYNAQTTMYVHV